MMVSGLDTSMTDNGWEIVPPRDPSCLKIEIVRNAKGYDPLRSAVAAFFTSGGSLITQAMGFQKWWLSSCTLRWRRPWDKNEEEVVNMWINRNNNNEFERTEQDPVTHRWYVWRRPRDYNPDDPNDDRWDKIPI